MDAEEAPASRRYSGPAGTVTSAWLGETFWSLGNLRRDLTLAGASSPTAPGAATWVSPSGWRPHHTGGSDSALLGQHGGRDERLDAQRPVTPGGWAGAIEANSGTHYWWFGTSSSGSEQYNTPDPGDLTSKPIILPAEPPMFCVFGTATRLKRPAPFGTSAGRRSRWMAAHSRISCNSPMIRQTPGCAAGYRSFSLCRDAHSSAFSFPCPWAQFQHL
jgi:hypothetical protein